MLKKFQKRIKKDYQLALDLYDTGNYDAMYLAGLIADDARMTRKDLQHWVEKAYAGSLPGATVPWVAAESQFGRELALEWIDSTKPNIAAATGPMQQTDAPTAAATDAAISARASRCSFRSSMRCDPDSTSPSGGYCTRSNARMRRSIPGYSNALPRPVAGC